MPNSDTPDQIAAHLQNARDHIRRGLRVIPSAQGDSRMPNPTYTPEQIANALIPVDEFVRNLEEFHAPEKPDGVQKLRDIINIVEQQGRELVVEREVNAALAATRKTFAAEIERLRANPIPDPTQEQLDEISRKTGIDSRSMLYFVSAFRETMKCEFE
jgi:hypothetical protein